MFICFSPLPLTMPRDDEQRGRMESIVKDGTDLVSTWNKFEVPNTNKMHVARDPTRYLQAADYYSPQIEWLFIENSMEANLVKSKWIASIWEHHSNASFFGSFNNPFFDWGHVAIARWHPGVPGIGVVGAVGGAPAVVAAPPALLPPAPAAMAPPLLPPMVLGAPARPLPPAMAPPSYGEDEGEPALPTRENVHGNLKVEDDSDAPPLLIMSPPKRLRTKTHLVDPRIGTSAIFQF
jgi:hypothetical protein